MLASPRPVVRPGRILTAIVGPLRGTNRHFRCAGDSDGSPYPAKAGRFGRNTGQIWASQRVSRITQYLAVGETTLCHRDYYSILASFGAVSVLQYRGQENSGAWAESIVTVGILAISPGYFRILLPILSFRGAFRPCIGYDLRAFYPAPRGLWSAPIVVWAIASLDVPDDIARRIPAFAAYVQIAILVLALTGLYVLRCICMLGLRVCTYSVRYLIMP